MPRKEAPPREPTVLENVELLNREYSSGLFPHVDQDGVVQLGAVTEKQVTDDEAFEVGVSHVSPAESGRSAAGERFPRAQLVNLGKYLLRSWEIGGTGVTGRGLKELESAVPGVSELLQNATSSVAFFGNGLSEVPFMLEEKIQNGTASVTIVDVIDYANAEREMADIVREYQASGLVVPGRILDMTKRLQAFNEKLSVSGVRAVRHAFGVGTPSPELHDLGLAVNVHGPTVGMDEQLSALASGGVLAVNLSPRFFERYSDVVSIEEVHGDGTGREGSSIIRKK